MCCFARLFFLVARFTFATFDRNEFSFPVQRHSHSIADNVYPRASFTMQYEWDFFLAFFRLAKVDDDDDDDGKE